MLYNSSRSIRKTLDFRKSQYFKDVSGNFLIETSISSDEFSLEDGLVIELNNVYNDSSYSMVIKNSVAGSTLSLGNLNIFLGDSFITVDAINYSINSSISQVYYILGIEVFNDDLTIYHNGNKVVTVNSVNASIGNIIFESSTAKIKHIIASANLYQIEEYLSELYGIELNRLHKNIDPNDYLLIHVPNLVDIDLLEQFITDKSLQPISIGTTDINSLINSGTFNSLQNIGIGLSENDYLTNSPVQFKDTDVFNNFAVSRTISFDEKNYCVVKNGILIFYFEFAPSNRIVTWAKRIMNNYIDYYVFVYLHSFIDENSQIIDANSAYNSAQYF